MGHNSDIMLPSFGGGLQLRLAVPSPQSRPASESLLKPCSSSLPHTPFLLLPSSFSFSFLPDSLKCLFRIWRDMTKHMQHAAGD